MWREDPSTTMIVAWDQQSGSNPILYYDTYDGGRDMNQYTKSAEPSQVIFTKGMRNHFVRLRGLEPNTVYYFVVKDSEGTSKRYSFKTIPDNPYHRLSIIAGGDSRNHRTARTNANKLVAKLRPHCVMFGGDMTGSDTDKQWQNWFDDWQKSIGEDGRITPIIVTRGNHEYSNRSLVELFDTPNKTLYYSFGLGGNLIRSYTLNTLIATGGDQKAWLKKDLEENKHYLWKFAQYHYAIRPHTRAKSERNDQLKNWATLFEQYKVQLVVESDIHTVKSTYPIRPSKEPGSDEGFIRDDLHGTVYIGEGCWGAPLRRNNDDKEWTRASGSFNSFKWIWINEDKVEVRTVKTDNANEVAAVDPDHIFEEPRGINIWAPSTGRVIEIFRKPAAATYSSTKSVNQPVFRGPSMMINDFAANLINNELAIEWNTEHEPKDVVFEVQRSNGVGNFLTIAHINGQSSGMQNGTKYSYKITDPNFETAGGNNLVYRLKRVNPSGKTSFYTAKDINLKAVEWKKFQKLVTDPVTGLVKVQYVIDSPGDVNIKLVDYNEESVSESNYEHQKTGNYLKSIDMRTIPHGRYLLIIKTEERVIRKYQVEKRT